MRDASLIQDIWNRGGPFTGEEGKPNTIVTVQTTWGGEDGKNIHFSERESVGTMRIRGIPLRWYQKADNSQNEREIPNIASVSIDRSIDTDAATCNLSIYNQWMYDNGAIIPSSAIPDGNRGLSGYFTPTRSMSPDDYARWGHISNEWQDILVPNAILRTYQGFGGHSKTRQQAIADGNIILTGVWLIDEVRINAKGMLDIQCRDMAKLLVEQQLYLPLVPSDKYPLTYYRWSYDTYQVRAAARTETANISSSLTAGDKRTVFVDSAVDHWYPQGSPGSQIPNGGYLLHGHRAIDCLDGNPSTYCLSVGNSGPDKPFASDWWEFDCGEFMNAVYVHPWAGNYEMYVSVKENGAWQGSQVVPYDTTIIEGQSYWVDHGADIPYVAMFGTSFESGQEYVLDRAYNAERVRVSFRHQTDSGIGPWRFRAGMREFKIRGTTDAGSVSTGSTSMTSVVRPTVFAADAHPDSGYMTITSFWQLDVFGDSRYDEPPPVSQSGDIPWAIRHTPTADGYHIMDSSGRIFSYGTFWLGDPYTNGYRHVPGQYQFYDMALTHTGNGYWCLDSRGEVHAFGDAVSYGNHTPSANEFFISIDSHPSGMGYWAMDTGGKVTATGVCTDFGDFTEVPLAHQTADAATCLRGNVNGDGYWILTDSGRVQNFGAADDFGEITDPVTPTGLDFYSGYYKLLPEQNDLGYLIVKGDGNIYPFGGGQETFFYGSPVPGNSAEIRRPGNYLDYADIIKDLALWSGFLLYDEDLSDYEPAPVFGNIESTGAYAEERLPDDIFDKRPVIDAMTEIKEVVGYILFVDDEGGLRFESPNFWTQGNFMQGTGERVQYLPEIDERVNLTDYGVSFNDESLRSLIIISSEDPDEAGLTTVTTKHVPQTAKNLRGLLKPAMWVNGWFQNKDEQQVMAELIAMHIWFAQRIGQVSCVANPCIQINDQVRIYERQTSEVYIHYVRGVATNHDLDSGEYTMTLTTHWLGTGERWAVTGDASETESPDRFVMSPTLADWVSRRMLDLETEPVGPTWVVHDPDLDTNDDAAGPS